MIQGFEGSYSHSQNGMTRADMEYAQVLKNAGFYVPKNWVWGA